MAVDGGLELILDARDAPLREIGLYVPVEILIGVQFRRIAWKVEYSEAMAGPLLLEPFLQVIGVMDLEIVHDEEDRLAELPYQPRTEVLEHIGVHRAVEEHEDEVAAVPDRRYRAAAYGTRVGRAQKRGPPAGGVAAHAAAAGRVARLVAPHDVRVQPARLRLDGRVFRVQPPRDRRGALLPRPPFRALVGESEQVHVPPRGPPADFDAESLSYIFLYGFRAP